MNYDYLVVGSGLFGSVLAERIANDMEAKVLVIEKRSHIGGNCFSKTDKATGIEYHQYGTHIFHTSSSKVWDYITRFTKFNSYHHQVLTTWQDKVYQMPFNLETINSFFNLNLNPIEAKIFLAKEISKEMISQPKNLEEKAISLIGRSLYEAFIKGYSIKQWGKDPKELPASIISRIPVRFNYNENYFLDAKWQGVPLEGYTIIFDRLLASKNIHVELNCDYLKNRKAFKARKKTIFTGAIDSFFNHEFGRLDWRSVKFESSKVEVEDYQGTSVMNYADIEFPYTRIHEPRHLHPERRYSKKHTMIIKEKSISDSQNPYYPIKSEENQKLFKKYKALAQKDKQLIIGGRLGDYAYYDMDKTIAAALHCYETEIT